jgi:hypothetical protein
MPRYAIYGGTNLADHCTISKDWVSEYRQLLDGMSGLITMVAFGLPEIPNWST